MARNRLLGALIAAAVGALGSACSLTIPLKAPTPSALACAGAPHAGVALELSDQRSPSDRGSVASSPAPVSFTFAGGSFDPMPYFSDAIAKELAARGFATEGADRAPVKLVMRSFHFENHRVSGFSPWVTLTLASADLDSPSGPLRIVSFLKRGKVPVWSMDEINDPCFNDSLSIVTKEITAKLISALWGKRLNDADVEAIVARIAQKGEADSTWLDVYELGFSNNPRAIPELAKLTAHSNEYIRMAAISGLGTLRAVEQFEQLKSIASGGQLWQDRAIALKAIGDLGTPEAKAFLEAESKRLGNDLEGRWSRMVIALFQ